MGRVVTIPIATSILSSVFSHPIILASSFCSIRTTHNIFSMHLRRSIQHSLTSRTFSSIITRYHLIADLRPPPPHEKLPQTYCCFHPYVSCAFCRASVSSAYCDGNRFGSEDLNEGCCRDRTGDPFLCPQE